MKPILLTIIALGCMMYLGAQERTNPDYLALMDEALHIEYADIRMEVLKNDKIIKYYVMEFHRKGNKIRMEMTGPAAEKGRRMLNEETNLWMYMPRTSKVMKLPMKQAFMGSDASNRDLMRIAFAEDYDIIGISLADDQGCIRIELKAKDLSVSYHKVVMTFDTARQVPVKQEMYSLSDKLIKSIEYTYDKLDDGKLYVASNIIRDELLRNSETRMQYSNVRRTNNKPAVFFTLGSLKQ